MHEVTLIKGDGIGPEVVESARRVIEATGVNINWNIYEAGIDLYNKTGVLIEDSALESIRTNRVALKGPITTPIGSGFRSINVQLRKRYDLYANIRPIKSLRGIKTPYSDIDIVIFRENTEGLYCGSDIMIDDNRAEATKITTRKGSVRIVEKAFDFANSNSRRKVTVVHKANILKNADGLFLECAREVAKSYPSIELEEVIVDNMCMQLVLDPCQFDVIVTTNLYGDIISDLCAGLVGGLGLVSGANLNDDIGIFEAVHGSAPDIAGKGLANPTAVILSGAQMLNHIGEADAAESIVDAVSRVIAEGKVVTKDIGGSATTSEMTEAIINEIARR